ncbi:hypothetical protein BO79DRAFT_287674 [Aspergillus costaricaensis CBS 115574]|uniref:Uncharacterized protein n=1 Tax=Aspergillus costaricaensis CBS 115574 TaxID=1448317 RepID=A0ACD1IEK2_9EURO|nr:hypothetical protein BO79DRAFT_287674 [Aspergillus costaricaensis CBS 115574]RAK88663.1 hypothetical protein BO79DRAFT_287674 [Aspergillus costaricaensis CBS 115574]
MLFHIKGFKSISTTGPVLDSPEKLYSLTVLEGLRQQELKLKDELLDKYVFCQTIRETTGFRIALEIKLLASTLRSRMCRAGQITGFDAVTKPYILRYAGAKAFNSSEVTDALQNVILQHADIRTFIRHYEVDVDVDVQGIIRKTGSQTPLVRFACSLSASIDPDRPYWLSADESKSLNQLPEIPLRASFDQLSDEASTYRSHQSQEKIEVLQDRVLEAKRKYNKSVREVRNEKQRQRNRQIRENLKRYRNEQPVIDLERQLAGKLVNTKVMDALEQRRSMPGQQMLMIDAILTMLGATLEAEQRRLINAINAVTAFCGVEEGRPTRRPSGPGWRPAPDCDESHASVKRRRICADDETELALRQADGRERGLLTHLLNHPELDKLRNRPTAILSEIDRWAAEHNYCMMTIGTERSKPIVDLIHECEPQIMAELGGYIGYSAILFGNEVRRAGGTQYLSLESNTQYASIAKELVQLAGLGDFVRILVGPSSESLVRLSEAGYKKVDILFMDHAERLYLSDLKLAEELRLVESGAFVVADNVESYLAKEYVRWVDDGQGRRYESRKLDYILPNGELDAVLTTKIL